jgi:hypothetical protein
MASEEEALLLDAPFQELVARLSGAVGRFVELAQQIIWEIDLDLGHIASIGRGFG